MPVSTRASRGTAYAALAGVSAIAAVVSYLHALDVVRSVGATPPVSYLIPFLADLVILGASAALLDAARRGERVAILPALSLAAGVGVTLAMNVAAGWRHGTAAALVAGWPAVAFILALESIAGMVRRGRGVPSPKVSPAAPDQCGHVLPDGASKEDKIVMAYRHATECEGKKNQRRAIGRQYGVHHATVSKLVKASANGSERGE